MSTQPTEKQTVDEAIANDNGEITYQSLIAVIATSETDNLHEQYVRNRDKLHELDQRLRLIQAQVEYFQAYDKLLTFELFQRDDWLPV